MNKFRFLSVYNSPFVRPKIKLYWGKITVGVPYFLPRKLRKLNGENQWVNKKFGFDFVGLGWKTKWDDDDFRFEWNPMISFVFWKWQIVLSFVSENSDTYWEAWLYYELRTDKTKSKMERLAQCRVKFPITETTYEGNKKYVIDWYDFILKEKYVIDHEYDRIFKELKK
jgi:hypothetical protein